MRWSSLSQSVAIPNLPSKTMFISDWRNSVVKWFLTSVKEEGTTAVYLKSKFLVKQLLVEWTTIIMHYQDQINCENWKVWMNSCKKRLSIFPYSWTCTCEWIVVIQSFTREPWSDWSVFHYMWSLNCYTIKTLVLYIYICARARARVCVCVCVCVSVML